MNLNAKKIVKFPMSEKEEIRELTMKDAMKK